MLMTRRLTLWRAAVTAEPWFGPLSFWALSEHGALWFAQWIGRAQNQDALAADGAAERVGPRAIYSADVVVANERVLDLTTSAVGGSLFVSSAVIVRLFEAGRLDHLDWVLFHEGAVEGEVLAQAVYVGRDRVSVAERCHQL
jgi:hypothetical protein